MDSVMYAREKFQFRRDVGDKVYEFKDHLGNVRVTFNDMKQPINENDLSLGYTLGLESISNYYPFGMQMPGMSWNEGDGYRNGFKGMEQDDEVYGEGNIANYTYRMNDTRLGRFFAVDPLKSKYPFYTPYAFSGNRVIDAIELEGLEPVNLMNGTRVNFGTQAELNVLKSNEYTLWRDMLIWEKSNKYEKAIENASEDYYLERQEMDWAYGDDLNTDYYAVNITQLPTGMSQTDLYNHLRKNLGDFIDAEIAELAAYDDDMEKKWISANPTGALMTFHNLMDDAPVLTSQSSSTQWVFTPITTFWDSEHPIAGHRQFGLSANDNGTFTFYTRGVDMLWDILDHYYNESESGGRFFNEADKLWNGVMDGVVDYINKQGGKAMKTHNFRRTIDWKEDINENDK